MPIVLDFPSTLPYNDHHCHKNHQVHLLYMHHIWILQVGDQLRSPPVVQCHPSPHYHYYTWLLYYRFLRRMFTLSSRLSWQLLPNFNLSFLYLTIIDSSPSNNLLTLPPYFALLPTPYFASVIGFRILTYFLFSHRPQAVFKSMLPLYPYSIEIFLKPDNFQLSHNFSCFYRFVIYNYKKCTIK